MNWECSSLFEIVTSFILDEYLAVGYACSRFNFGGNLHTVVHCGYTGLHSQLRGNFSWALGKSGC